MSVIESVRIGADLFASVSYDQAMASYLHRRPPVDGHLINVEGLAPDDTTYNCSPWVDNDKLEVLVREERKGATTEVSRVRRFDSLVSSASREWTICPNGLTIPDAQDPSISLVSPDQAVIGVVSITRDMARQRKVASYRPLFLAVEGNGVSLEKAFKGPESQKDIRMAYMGNHGQQDVSVVVARERQTIDGKILSYLQVGLIPSSSDMQSLSTGINEVKNDPASRVDVFIQDDETWLGPNQIVPLHSETNELAFGLIFHTGRLSRHVYENRERGRIYDACATEMLLNPKSGRVTYVSPPRVIATYRDFPHTKAKRPDLSHVVFPGGCIFAIKDGKVIRTFLIGGLRDKYNMAAEIRNPFIRPVNVELNPFYTIQHENMPALAAA